MTCCMIHSIKTYCQKQIIECLPPVGQPTTPACCSTTICQRIFEQKDGRNDKTMHGADNRTDNAYFVGTGIVFVRMRQTYKCNSVANVSKFRKCNNVAFIH